MHRYILTSNKTTGEIEVVYIDGLLRTINTEALEVTLKAVKFFMNHMPLNETDIDEFVKAYNTTYKPNTIKIERADLDVSFEDFWNAYKQKFNRPRCEKIWAKMSLQKRQKAFNRIKDYDRYILRTGIAKKHPDTYLRNESYNDEF